MAAAGRYKTDGLQPMTYAEVERWILNASMSTLEAKVLSFNHTDRTELLNWAKDLEQRKGANKRPR